MRKVFLAVVAAGSLSLGACATHDPQLRGAATGAAVGAAVGAGVGAVTDIASPVGGAAVGAVAGGAIGAATAGERRWYRDERGYCYYLGRDNQRVYDYNRRC